MISYSTWMFSNMTGSQVCMDCFSFIAFTWYSIHYCFEFYGFHIKNCSINIENCLKQNIDNRDLSPVILTFSTLCANFNTSSV